MTLLVIGSGGREHTLVWLLAQDPRVTKIFCATGNGGIEKECLISNGSIVECVPIAPSEIEKLRDFARDNKVDLTIVGPEVPLCLGIVDLFEEAGLKIVGPNKRGALFEGSKVEAQRFMLRHNLPTADSDWGPHVDRMIEVARTWDGKCAVKANGLAQGKGVDICRNMKEAEAAIRAHLVDKKCKEASGQIVLQKLLEGREVSIMIVVDGKTYKILPTSQDYKLLKGLNTGGMGAYSPSRISEQELATIENQIIIPWMNACAKDGIVYKGIMYFGIMITAEGPKILEFNVRLGDPETQVILPRLKSSLLSLFLACVEGKLEEYELEVKDEVAVCVVLASEGYPGDPIKNRKIKGVREVSRITGTKVFHAGTVTREEELFTDGGRVVGVTVLRKSRESARNSAHSAARMIEFDGKQMVTGIAAD